MLEINGVRMIIVVVPDAAKVAAIAVELVEKENVALIELDGGLGVSGAAQVIDAIKDAVPVGAVMFGAESLINAADFIARYDA
jgi:pentose-5-phosphate-3-epimerase